jgi:PucR C-terminal helix-turn-helix domain/GGDEF-like domain
MSESALAPVRAGAQADACLPTPHAVFVLSQLMFAARDADEILRLGSSAVRALGSVQSEAAFVVEGGVARAVDIGGRVQPGAPARVPDLPAGGAIDLDRGTWSACLPLVGLAGCQGYLVVTARSAPQQPVRFLLDVLARYAAVALENAAGLRAAGVAGRLRREQESARAARERSIRDLERTTRMYAVLSRAAQAPDVPAAVAAALHGATGLPVGVEDAVGRRLAWSAPPGVPAESCLPDTARDEVGRAVLAVAGRPARWGRSLVALARPGTQVLGAVVLSDPDRVAGEFELSALEQAATIVGTELAHRRTLAELELRMRRHLVDDLVTGNGEGGAERATVLGHDLRGSLRAVVARWEGVPDVDLVVAAAERAADRLGLDALVAPRDGTAVLLVGGSVDGGQVHEQVAAELRSRAGAVGVGGSVTGPAGLPRSYEEATRALAVRQRSRAPHGVTRYEDLGLYRVLRDGEPGGEVDTFLHQWLGRLIDYDAARRTTLVATLAEFLDRGGSYDDTAAALCIHRSTLRYRLRRIRELTGLQLTDVESRLNLHVATRVWRVLEGR